MQEVIERISKREAEERQLFALAGPYAPNEYWMLDNALRQLIRNRNQVQFALVERDGGVFLYRD